METAMPAFSTAEMAHAEKVLEKVRSEWLQRPGVTAVDLGFEWSQGVMTGHFAGEVGNAPEYALAHEITPALERLHVCFPAQKPTEPEPPEDVKQPAPPPSFWQTMGRYLRRLFGWLWR
jgi:hypothetical protein